MFFLARKSSTVEERSEAIVRKLEVLDQRLASKVMPIIKCMLWLYHSNKITEQLYIVCCKNL